MPRTIRQPAAVLTAFLAIPLLASAIQTNFLDVNAVVSGTPTPQVSFSWDSQADWATVEVARRAMGLSGGAGTWSARGVIDHPTTSFVDAIVPGVAYEYRVRRPYNAANSSYREVAAFVAVALGAPLVEDRGGLLLVVDQTVTNALTEELRVLEMDLVGEGWTVQRLDFARDGAATPESLRTAVTNAYALGGGTLKALYLFGHLPVAKSGWIAPDGHSPLPQHADGFYGDMDGSWSDTASRGTGNVVGDGIYDQDYFPSTLELMVGRTDFAVLPAMHKRELENLRDYIHKSHAFRHGLRTELVRRGLWNSGYLWPERNWINPLFGTANVTYAPFQPTLATTPHLFGIDFGTPGGNSAEYVETANQLIFGVNFGSGKLYWSDYNNAMRALLAQPDWGLTCVWGARPSWFFHHMGVGLPVGYSAMRTMNNSYLLSGYNNANIDYYPNGDYNWMAGYVGEALMGDPTLRLHPVAPPPSVTVEQQGDAAVLSWTASPDAEVSTYHVYRAVHRLGPYTRLTAAPVAGLTYTDDTPPTGDAYFQVRALKLETTPAATYTNASAGGIAHLHADGTANHAPTAVSTNLGTSAGQFLSLPMTGADADGDTLTPVVTRNPGHGELRWNGTQVTYVPAAGFSGADSVVYVLSDGDAVSAPATNDIAVAAYCNLLEWEFGSPANGVSQDLGSTSNAPGILPATLALGSAVSLRTDLAIFQDDGVCLNSAPVGGLNPNGYVEWQVRPATDTEMSLERASLGLWNYDASRPLNAELRWSVDGFETWGTVPLGLPQVTLAGPGYAAHEGLPFAGELHSCEELQATTNTVAFRLYLWHGADTTVCGLGKLGSSRIDLMVAGTTAPFEGEPPIITSALSATGTVGVAFSYAITAENAPTGFAATGLPAGLSLDAGTGAISGVPVEACASSVTLSATNAWGTGEQQLELVVGATITATAGDGGGIDPAGVVFVGGGATQSFTVVAAAYSTIVDVQVDGNSVGAVAEYRFENVTTNHTIHATFEALRTTRGTPYWWLAGLGWTGDFEVADLDDPDGDGVPNWREFPEDTDPLDPLSRPAYNAVPYAESFENLAGWGGDYANVAGRMGWQSSSPAEDASRIVAHPYVFAATNPPLPAATHTNALRIATQGTRLESGFGDGHPMTGSVTYVDLLTQLVPSETAPPDYTPDDTGTKAGVYLDPENRLVVYHGVATSDGTWVSNRVSRTDCVLGTNDWFRLTYALDATVTNGCAPAMFRVWVDGVSVTNEAAYDDGWKAAYVATGALPPPGPGGRWFRFASTNATCATLTAVSFSGEGYIDDLRVDTADPFAVLGATWWLTVASSGAGASSLGRAAWVAVEVPAGTSTQIVYAADDWHRIGSLATDGQAVPEAGGRAVFTQLVESVAANVSNHVAFALATPEQTGYAGVPTAWLANWSEAAVRHAPADGYDVATKRLLGLDPTASNTYLLAVESLQVRGAEAVAVARRNVTGPLAPDGMHGILVLQHAGDLGPHFTNLPGATVTGSDAFDGEGRRAFTNALPDGAAAGFFRVAVQPGE